MPLSIAERAITSIYCHYSEQLTVNPSELRPPLLFPKLLTLILSIVFHSILQHQLTAFSVIFVALILDLFMLYS